MCTLREACCIKGRAASKYVALVAGPRNTVDSSMFQKSLRAPEQNLCIETWHFTVSTRGQIHKRTSTKSSQNLYEWREPWSSWNILSLLLHTDWYLHQAAQTYLGYFLWSGKLSCWGWGHYRRQVWWASEAPQGGANIVIKSSSARTVSKLKCRGFFFLFFSSLAWTTAKHILITWAKSTCTSLSQVHDKPINFLKCPESAKHFNLLHN